MVGDFTQVAGWMRLAHVDRLARDMPAHVIAWRFTDDGTDPWTKRINAFKAKERAALAGAIHTLRKALPFLMDAYNWLPDETGLVSAMSSRESEFDPSNPLSKVGYHVANNIGLVWLPGILSKNPHGRLHKIYEAEKRDAEAARADYKCQTITDLRRVLILDDMITRGSTAANIAEAVSRENSHLEVFPLALGKTERKCFAASLGRKLDNEHVPSAWARTWDQE